MEHGGLLPAPAPCRAAEAGFCNGDKWTDRRGSRGASRLNTARGTPGNRRNVATTACVHTTLFVHRVMGRSAPRRSAHPRTFEGWNERPKTTAYPTPAKQYGRRSAPAFTSPASGEVASAAKRVRARPRVRTRQSCPCGPPLTPTLSRKREREQQAAGEGEESSQAGEGGESKQAGEGDRRRGACPAFRRTDS